MPNRPKYLNLTPKPTATRADSAEADMGFYRRAAWRKLRALFLSLNPLCVRCLERDELVPATIPHHKLERRDRPDLALDATNLEALCSSCHSQHHGGPKG